MPMSNPTVPAGTLQRSNHPAAQTSTRRKKFAGPLGRGLCAAALLCLSACGSGRPMPLDADPTKPVPEDVMNAESLFDLTVPGLDGQPVSLADYRGKTLVIVNTATECGFTGQLADLETIQGEYGSKGVQILAFPSNDFGGQEPLEGDALESVCRTQYGASYPILGKVRVKAGEGQSPVYARLQQITEALPGWNFGKYVMSKDGKRARYFGPMTNPTDQEFRSALDEALQ